MDNRLLAFAKLALAVAQRVLPERAHKFAPKTYTQPQLLACLPVKEYLQLDYRTAQEVLDASGPLRRILRLRRAPDYSTLWHFAQEKVTPELIRQALAETVRLLQADSPPPPPGRSASGEDPLRCVALDSTGQWTTRASRHFEWRIARAKPHGSCFVIPFTLAGPFCPEKEVPWRSHAISHPDPLSWRSSSC